MVSSFVEPWPGGRYGWTRAPTLRPLIPKEETVLTTGVIGRTGGKARRVLTTGLLAAGVITAATVSTAVMGVGTAGASSPLGAAHPATLAPVTIGLISDGGGSSSIGTAALVEQGAKAAVAYENQYQDGLEGHKITLYICENQSTPAGGQTCANDMVQHGVVAVVEPFTGQGQTEVPTIVGAGIPYITISGASTAELTSPGAFALEGGFPAYLGAMALSAKQHNLTKVAFLVENVPAAIQGAQELGGIVYKAAGVGFTVIPINPGTADISPQMQSAVSGGAQAVGMVGDVTLCSSFLQAYNTLALKLPKYVLSTCQDPSILNSATLDKALAGSYITTTTQASKADLATYGAIIKKYDPKANPNPNISSNQADGVTPVLALSAIMKGSTQPVTAAGVKTQTETAKNVVIPLSGGLTFTCDGTAIPLLKSVCSSSAAIGVIQAGKSGKVTSIKVYNPTPLF
jgi:branched-chain amino acid transport system substrate-binding protein